jgi:hypothetical protein
VSIKDTRAHLTRVEHGFGALLEDRNDSPAYLSENDSHAHCFTSLLYFDGDMLKQAFVLIKKFG